MSGLVRGPEPIYFYFTDVDSGADFTGPVLLLVEAVATIGPDV